MFKDVFQTADLTSNNFFLNRMLNPDINTHVLMDDFVFIN